MAVEIPVLESLVIFTDGGARGNPGPAGIGAIFYHQDEFGKRSKLKKLKKYIGKQTNNFAEYTALIMALETAKDIKTVDGDVYKNIQCYLDSELVVKQLNGLYKVREQTLKLLIIQIRELKKNFKNVIFNHVHREQNSDADELVNEALDAEEKKA